MKGNSFNYAHLLFIPLVAVLAIEYFYFSGTGSLNSEIPSLVSLTSEGVILGLWNYFFLMSRHPAYGPLGRVPPGSSIDDQLTDRYNSKYYTIAGKKFEIYTYRYQPVIGTKSPVFSIYGRIPKIFVNEMFFKGCPVHLADALILHEVGHIRHRDNTIVPSIALLFIISIGAVIISILNTLIYGFNAFNEWFVAISIAFAVGSVLILKIQFMIQEPRADRFAAKAMGDSTPLVEALDRSFSYVVEHAGEKREEKLKTMKAARERKLAEIRFSKSGQ